VAEVAAEAVTSVSRIESYAYPVMLERANMAEKARAAHPMVDGNPSRRTLEELITATLRQRGHADGMRWDAYRSDGGWIVALHWYAGRSDNLATWEIHTGTRTTTLRARDDAARELLDPSPRPLRTIAEAPTEPARTDGASLFDPPAARPVPAAAGPEGSRHPAGTRRPAEAPSSPAAPKVPIPPAVQAPATPAPVEPTTPAHRPAAELTGTDQVPTRSRRQRPVMPGWEDVLLGGHSKG
jgi:hypothetical protein